MVPIISCKYCHNYSFFSSQMWGSFFFLGFLRCNLHTVKFTLFKGPHIRVLTNICSCNHQTNQDIHGLFPSSPKMPYMPGNYYTDFCLLIYIFFVFSFVFSIILYKWNHIVCNLCVWCLSLYCNSLQIHPCYMYL